MENNPKNLIDRIMTLINEAVGSSEVFSDATVMTKKVIEDDKVIEAIYSLLKNMGDILRNIPTKELADLIDIFVEDKELVYGGLKLVRETLPIFAFGFGILGIISPIAPRLTDNDNVKKGLATIITGMMPVFDALPAIISTATPLIVKLSKESNGLKEGIKPVLSHLTTLAIELRKILEDNLQFITGVL